MGKKTAIIGASPNPSRYSYLATKMLSDYDHEVVPLGIRKGEIEGKEIVTEWPKSIDQLHTVTLYIGPTNQPEHYDYILELKPERLIFNPGTNNPEFQRKAEERGIETLEACTLIMLRTDQY